MLDQKLYNNLTLYSSLEMKNEGTISLAIIDIGGVFHEVMDVSSWIQALVLSSHVFVWGCGHM